MNQSTANTKLLRLLAIAAGADPNLVEELICDVSRDSIPVFYIKTITNDKHIGRALNAAQDGNL